MTSLTGITTSIPQMTGPDLLRELLPVCETELERHMKMAKDWYPHEYVPWDGAYNFATLGGDDWDPTQSTLSDASRAALVGLLLTEDNLPSYHRMIAEHVSLDDAWGAWVGRWTAEEMRHSTVIRDYLVVTRGVDPVQLDIARTRNAMTGFNPLSRDRGLPEHSVGMLLAITYMAFHELASRVSQRNAAKSGADPIVVRLLHRVAGDETLHMLFYRNIIDSALDLAPDQTMEAIYGIVTTFQMPGASPVPGSSPALGRIAALIAEGGIYDLHRHRSDVVVPLLRKWRVFERDDFGPTGQMYRDKLAGFLSELNQRVEKFDHARAQASRPTAFSERHPA
ncbi:acyl-ACP desaturase [Gordonia amarae]|uniref:Acyl-[acyl-carrier-protein] desaturase n=2 Tax=Gordonia amarae TaxID=36821 RepID=G7GU35_9ACTN|nr:acyl-ACP desaturase [Gordonia amarae]MCS3878699.1 acyl-[acyl-carrier-protein] desaturase [Gordonia amarae]QHN17285.1 acyl-ACP desaturase [Gordonia amarae]QHN21811.1 acyl-ACP desaturase [Gordonia amarae]QHN30661.1 acyl-ACP desaturase [Gordonia amarae]QHN39438.1 acyl-ACP desaturase [Gordonia amarae]